MEENILEYQHHDYFLIVTLLITVFLYTILSYINFVKKLPPGPLDIPFWGSLTNMVSPNPMNMIENYVKKYGKIFTMNVGQFRVIVISDIKMILDGLKREEFSGRPEFEVWHLRSHGVRNRGVLASDAPVWTEQRRFSLRTLRDFGFGKQSMEGLITYELQELVELLKKSSSTVMDLSGNFNASVLNSLWSILTGHRYELDDPEFKEALLLLTKNLQGSTVTSPGMFFPWPAKMNLVRPGAWAQGTKLREKCRQLIYKELNEHFKTYDPDQTRDFIDTYIHEINRSEPGSSFYGTEGRFNLYSLILDLFIAGAETTSTTLLWAILYLTQNMEVQKKLYGEIERVIGNRLPTRNDKPKLLYVEAVLSEVHRMCSLLPFSVYHRMTRNLTYEGYLLPKDSVVFFNLHGLHHSKEHWGDPENFRPERFLNKEETAIIKHDAFIPFSAGKRQCLGEALARDTLFLFFTGLIQKFHFEPDPANPTPDTKALPNFLMSPKPYQVKFTCRE